MEDFNGEAVFKLVSPQGGKVHRGKNWNAYNRQSLGSIPRSSENIIFKEKASQLKLGFESSVERFSRAAKDSSLPGPGTYFDSSSKSPNCNLSSKSGFPFSNSSRFSDYNEFLKKYEPGPGDYTVEKTNKSSIRSIKMKSPQKVTQFHPPAKSPGPGEYIYPEFLPSTFEGKLTKLLKKPSDWKLSSKRPNPFFNQLDKTPGPGEYNLGQPYRKINQKDYKISAKDKPLGKAEESKNLRYKIKKELDLLPKPQCYDFITHKSSIDMTRGHRFSSVEPKNSTSKLSTTEENLQNKILSLRRRRIEKEISDREAKYKRKVQEELRPFASFISSSPRIDHPSAKNPGPAYYSPLTGLVRNNFNVNLNRNFIV